MNKFNSVLEEIQSITKNATDKTEYDHSQSVWQWVLKLKPEADIALQIAALGHDIDRSFEGRRMKRQDFVDYNEYKKQHALLSAEIMCDILRTYNFDEPTIDKVKYLIENHEVGDEGDVEILKEADSITFFNDFSHYRQTHTREETIDKIKIAPGDVVDISIGMVAPTRGGEQTGNWEFQNAAGNRFGVGSGGADYIWVQVNVEWQGAGNSQSPVSQPPAPVVSAEGCTAAPNADFENQILSLINAGRAEQGLAVLAISPALSNAAREHSQDMACQGFVDHDGSDGSTWYDRVANQGYANANSARENIYVGNPAFGGTPAGAYSWWMNSPVHRDNILNPSVSEIGIGYPGSCELPGR